MGFLNKLGQVHTNYCGNVLLGFVSRPRSYSFAVFVDGGRSYFCKKYSTQLHKSDAIELIS